MELRTILERLQRFIFTGIIILVSLKSTEELDSFCGSNRYPVSKWLCCDPNSHCIDMTCGSGFVQKYCNITDPNIACPVIDLPWFKCRDKKRCYPRQSRCDGYKSCEDGSDEIGCGAEPMKASDVLFDAMETLTSDLHNSAKENNTLITKIALALSSTNRRFLKPNKDTTEAIVSELLQQLFSKLTLEKKISTYELSDYINALIVTCINPRDFLGFNLVAELRKRATQSNYTNPYAVLTLCNARAKILMEDVIELQNLFNAHLRTPWTETQALVTMALACISSHSGLQIEEKIIKEMVKELKMKQLKNGTVESLRTTALVVQALLATDSYQTEFDVHGAVELMVDKVKTDKVDLMDIYYILPVLNHMTLVDISSGHCAEDNEPNTELWDTKNLQDAPQNYILVQFSLYTGEKKQLLKTWELKVPDTLNLYQILEIISFLEPTYKVKYIVSNGKPYVVSVGNIIEDAEIGEFWFIYREEGTFTFRSKKSPVDVPVATNQKLFLWYKRGDWYPSIQN